MVGLPSPTPDVNLFPNDIVTFNFNEDIDCSKPHNFVVKARVKTASIRKINMVTICQGRSISVQLLRLRLSSVAGGTYTISLSEVKDINGNSLAIPIAYRFKFANWTVSQIPTTFGTVIVYNKPPPGSNRRLVTEENFQDFVRSQIATFANVSIHRVHVEFHCQYGDGGCGNYDHAFLSISPPSSPDENTEYDSYTAYQLLQENIALHVQSNISSKLFHSISLPEKYNNHVNKEIRPTKNVYNENNVDVDTKYEKIDDLLKQNQELFIQNHEIMDDIQKLQRIVYILLFVMVGGFVVLNLR
jgi:hypothetical protein